jgi:hypothetical protein
MAPRARPALTILNTQSTLPPLRLVRRGGSDLRRRVAHPCTAASWCDARDERAGTFGSRADLGAQDLRMRPRRHPQPQHDADSLTPSCGLRLWLRMVPNSTPSPRTSGRPTRGVAETVIRRPAAVGFRVKVLGCSAPRTRSRSGRSALERGPGRSQRTARIWPSLT